MDWYKVRVYSCLMAFVVLFWYGVVLLCEWLWANVDAVMR